MEVVSLPGYKARTAKSNGGITLVRIASLRRHGSESLEQKHRRVLCPGCGGSGPHCCGSQVKSAGAPGVLSSYFMTWHLPGT